MSRNHFGWALAFLILAGCRIVEREGMAPLPENAPPLSYAEMIVRVRGQAGAAQDAFYIDSWLDLEQAAQRLEQTARLLPKATEIPAGLKPKLEPEANQLRQDAVKLAEAARSKNAAQANEALQRINSRVRLLRGPEPADIPPPKKPDES